MWLLAGSAFHKSHQIGPNQDPGNVCILHPFLPAALPPFFPPKVPDFTSFFATRFAAVQLGSEGILTNGRTDTPGSANIAPASTSCCPQGGTKCQTTPDHVITDYTLTHPTILLGHSLKIWGLRGRARELSGDIFYAKDVPRQRALCHPPPTFRAPWVFPKFPPRKNLCISPRFTKLGILCVTNGDNVLGAQKWTNGAFLPILRAALQSLKLRQLRNSPNLIQGSDLRSDSI